MWRYPNKYVGRVARVKSQERYESGALRAPSFYDFHIEKSLLKGASMKCPKIIKEAGYDPEDFPYLARETAIEKFIKTNPNATKDDVKKYEIKWDSPKNKTIRQKAALQKLQKERITPKSFIGHRGISIKRLNDMFGTNY